MDIIITLLVILLIIFWPRRGGTRYYILLAVGLISLAIAVLFAPVLLLTPFFYLGVVVLVILGFYASFVRNKKGKSR